MSVNTKARVAYGFSQPLIDESPSPIISKRAPTTSDKAQFGTIWIDQPDNNAYVITSIVNNSANWEEIGGSGAALTFDGDTGTAMPSGGIITIAGSANIHTAASASTVEVILDDDVTISGDFTTTGGLFALPTTTSTAGQITLNSQPFLHAFDGNNIFAGANSGNFTMSSQFNVGIGTNSLSSLTASGGGQGANTAVGYNAGKSLTTGVSNVLIGIQSGQNLTTLTNASGITAVGQATLSTATSAGDTTAIGSAVLTSYTATVNPGNTAVGAGALNQLTTGTFNCVLGAQGFNAGTYTSNESGNLIIQNNGTVGDQNIIRIGTQGTGNGQQNTCFIAGITGATVTGSAVLCSTSGQLGTISSSIKTKENVEDIYNKSEVIYSLRPVVFNYIKDESKSKHYGLIAEEVQEVCPELVLYDNGEPSSVAYHELPALLLNEIKKLNKRIYELEKNKYC